MAAGLVAGEPCEISLVVSSAEPGGGAMENRRLQELLHQALRREAEALRKLKHLNETLLAGGDPACGTPTSPLATDAPVFRVDSPLESWDGEDSQCSEDSPAIVNLPQRHYRRAWSQPGSPITSQRKELSSPDYDEAIPIPNSNHVQHAQNGVGREWWDSDHLVHVSNSLPSHLAPVRRELKDVKSEREKPPPLVHRSTTPDQFTTDPLHKQNEQIINVKKSQSLDRNTFKEVMQKSSRSPGDGKADTLTRPHRSNSILRPSWLRRKRADTQSKPTHQRPPSIEALYTHFTQHSSNLEPDPLTRHIGRHWSEVCGDGGKCSTDVAKYRDAVWDLFQGECKYYTRQLQPLEQVYKAFLEELQFHGLLKVADIDKLFANLSELCELSASVCKDLFQLFDGRCGSAIASNDALILVFSMFGHKFNPVYQRFCVNFEKQRGFVRALQAVPEFQEYLRVCRTHKLVQKNDLSALLIAPMQHECHYQLLLDKILRYTKDQAEKSLLTSAIKAFVVSLKELQAKIAEHKRSAELLELQETLCWPSVIHLDPEAYVPEVLASLLSSQPCGDMLASKDRHLLHRGTLRLLDSRARPSMELHSFLFTDMLLLTEQKPSKKELTQYVVYRRPLFLKDLELHPIPTSPSHKHLFTLVEKTALNQRVAVYSLQTVSKEDKDTWVFQLLEAIDAIWQHRELPHAQAVIESDV